MERRLVWDLPTRLFHWLLVASLIVQYLTATWIENAMQWHFYCGYFTLGLLVFRLLWGLVGPTYARFTHFLTSPATVLNYNKTLFSRHSVAYTGHNPLGGYVVVLMLTMLITQAVSGLFMTDDIFMEGPWYASASQSVQNWMNTLHRTGFNWLLAIIALHITAVIFYAIFKKQPLTSAMLHGKKSTKKPAIRSSKLWLAAFLVVVTAILIYYLVVIAPPAPVTEEVYY
ncbi:cytochrome B [Salinimonas sp. HHU 13199]|uniref:Cytochrome B n=1 Tax=Salinimonas profundi TaxID=2729140 RepID=A0ABR8LH13_9ALTE|nr:cytochrome b/b6 domain-containing protein [Salinimonas profundi]MBD3585007.1 cytochrome B [Salinimonas profundi]